MKKIIYLISFGLVLSCNQSSNRRQVVGKWKVEKFDAVMLSADSEILKSGKEIVLSTTYVFNTDSIVLINSNIHDNVKGIYRIGNDSLNLGYSIDHRQLYEKFAIAEITSDKIILKQEIYNWADLTFILKKVPE